MSAGVKPEDQLVMAVYVRDIKESVEFYRKLGFELIRDEGTFVELRWEQSPLFLTAVPGFSTSGSHPVGNLRVLVPDVDRYWRLVNELGLKILRPIESRNYGMRDFIVGGPDGIAVRFATLLAP